MKTWVAGEEMLAADLQSFIQEQTIPKFANPTARDAQWTSPANGSVCVCTDTNTMFQRIPGIWYTPYARLARVVKSTTTTGIAVNASTTAQISCLIGSSCQTDAASLSSLSVLLASRYSWTQRSITAEVFSTLVN